MFNLVLAARALERMTLIRYMSDSPKGSVIYWTSGDGYVIACFMNTDEARRHWINEVCVAPNPCFLDIDLK